MQRWGQHGADLTKERNTPTPQAFKPSLVFLSSKRSPQLPAVLGTESITPTCNEGLPRTATNYNTHQFEPIAKKPKPTTVEGACDRPEAGCSLLIGRMLTPLHPRDEASQPGGTPPRSSEAQLSLLTQKSRGTFWQRELSFRIFSDLISSAWGRGKSGFFNCTFSNTKTTEHSLYYYFFSWHIIN